MRLRNRKRLRKDKGMPANIFRIVRASLPEWDLNSGGNGNGCSDV